MYEKNESWDKLPTSRASPDFINDNVAQDILQVF